MELIFPDILATLRDKIRKSKFQTPAYNTISHKIFFAGVEIQLPYDSDQDLLCKVLMENDRAIRREWSWDEIFEQWGEPHSKEDWRRVYNAGREVNQKIACETTIKDLLLVHKFSIALNPKYY